MEILIEEIVFKRINDGNSFLSRKTPVAGPS
jgi:hypothetical protein